jgi:hypothetical protein
MRVTFIWTVKNKVVVTADTYREALRLFEEKTGGTMGFDDLRDIKVKIND